MLVVFHHTQMMNKNKSEQMIYIHKNRIIKTKNMKFQDSNINCIYHTYDEILQ
jgi:hypothetical protein